MLFNNHYDYKQVRKYLATLHSMFESLSVTVNNKKVKVPLVTAEGERQRRTENGKSKFTVPRGGIRFDTFDINKDKTAHSKIRQSGPNGTHKTFNDLSTQYSYVIEYVFKTVDDAYEAIEQIVPRMFPSVDVRIVDNELHGEVKDIKVSLESWDINSNYDGDGEEAEETTLTLNVSVNGHLYHYMSEGEGNVIREIIVNLNIIDTDEEIKPWIHITEDTQNE